MTLLDTALTMRDACLSVVPVRADGTKAPAAFWKQYQDTPAPEPILREWFTAGAYDGLGVITGAVSGNLEMLEVEGRALDLVTPLAQLLTDSGFGDLWNRLCTGYLEQSPSGGWHWLYRVDGPDNVCRPNTKLARRPATTVELDAWKTTETAKAAEIDSATTRDIRLAKIAATTANQIPQVLIETRGEGGFVVTAPSAGRTHPSGLPWVMLAGDPTTIPILTVDERDALYAACSTFDAMPPVNAPAPATRGNLAAVDAGERPGDDYNTRATWEEILEPHGWTKGKRFGPDRQGWTRPGKDARDGISATTGDNLYVFSSSTEFDTETPYSKFGAYALLEHGGDHAAAARTLRGAGYGREPSRPTTLTIDQTTPADPTPAVHGNLATAPQLAVVNERTLLHSDDANALALIDRFGDVLRHCADRGRWYAWDGAVWAPCPRTAGPAREYAKRVARTLPERNDKDVSFKKKSLSAVGISAMLTQAASDERVAVDFDQLDAHPWELNTPGGIVDLATGQLLPSDPQRLHTRLTACTPDPDADRRPWLKFLDTTFGGDQALIDYMQRLVGYSAVGLVRDHVLPYCFGSGGNGKGVFLETCIRVLRDYATTAPAGFLMAKTFQGHETELARLSGARMVLCSEVNDDDRFDEARVKLLTGGDSITARFMQQDHFTFSPTHQLWAMGNHQPGVRAGGPSFWRRLRLIPFLHQVDPAEVIDDLQGIFSTEHGPAVLSWIIEGAVAYHTGGLQAPESVLAATKGYARNQDTVTRFLEEMCHVGGAPAVTTKVTVLRQAYETWCRETGDHPVSAKAFTQALQRHGVDSTRTSTARLYVGIALRVEASDNPSHLSFEPRVTPTEDLSHPSFEPRVTPTEDLSHPSFEGLR